MSATPSLQPISLSSAFWYWFKLGFISFCGPAGQIALMHAELVERRRWISERRFLHALNYCMLLPGPEATQLAVYIGWLMHRTAGGIMAGALFVLPSLAILVGLSWAYLAFGDVPAVAAVLYGIKPAVVAIVLAAAWRIGSRSLNNAFLATIAASAFVAITFLKLLFPVIVLAAALAGVLGARLRPHWFASAAVHGGTSRAPALPALIDDDTPTPHHARFSWARLLASTLTGIGLAALGLVALAMHYGMTNPLTQMGWFFTKAALVTFGGAYAVLPYVFQSAVEQHQWLSATQMMDGLALGETTPGPLIMIVAFVGFMGGWTKAVAGADALFSGGLLGACVATFFTFLPSFVFILAGGPLVEATRGNIRFSAPLTAISAAVVGVIVSLAALFAQHVFHLERAPAQWDYAAIALATAACVALIRFKVGVIPLILACALLGLGLVGWR